jgi:hypothetical protein
MGHVSTILPKSSQRREDSHIIKLGKLLCEQYRDQGESNLSRYLHEAFNNLKYEGLALRVLIEKDLSENNN